VVQFFPIYLRRPEILNEQVRNIAIIMSEAFVPKRSVEDDASGMNEGQMAGDR